MDEGTADASLNHAFFTFWARFNKLDTANNIRDLGIRVMTSGDPEAKVV